MNIELLKYQENKQNIEGILLKSQFVKLYANNLSEMHIV